MTPNGGGLLFGGTGGVLGSVGLSGLLLIVNQVTSLNVPIQSTITVGLMVGGILGAVGMLILKQMISLSKEVGELKGAIKPCQCDGVREDMRRWGEGLRRDIMAPIGQLELRIQNLEGIHLKE